MGNGKPRKKKANWNVQFTFLQMVKDMLKTFFSSKSVLTQESNKTGR